MLSLDNLSFLLLSRSGQLGGMELRLADEARFLASKKAKCLIGVSFFPNRDPWLEELINESPRFERFEFSPPPFFEEWYWRRTNLLYARLFWIQKLKQRHIDFAHIFYAWTFEGGSRLFLCHKAGIPCILSIHNSFPKVDLSAWHHKLTRESFAVVKGIYGVTQSALDHFLATYGSYLPDNALTCVVPNFVDLNRFFPSLERRRLARIEMDIPLDALVIGSVGRIDVQKQPFQILEVFDRLWNFRQDIYLVFCGQGPLSDMVKEKVSRKPWVNRVRFIGFRQDVERVYPAFDVHLLLSKQEGFGISTIEAMACGIPVVATNVPGTRDILERTLAGRMVSFGDLEEAAIEIELLFNSEEQRTKACAAGLQLTKDLYSKEQWAQQLEMFYSKVVGWQS